MDDIDAALGRAEQLFGLKQRGLADTYSTPGEAAPRNEQPLQQLATSTPACLAEELIHLRLSVHANNVEALRWEAQLRQEQAAARRRAEQAQELVRSRDVTIHRLQRDVTARERSLQSLGARLAEHASLAKRAADAERQVAEVGHRVEAQAAQVSDLEETWKVAKAELQRACDDLTSRLSRKTAECQALGHCAELLKAKLAAVACSAKIAAPLAAQELPESTQLQHSLMAALERAKERERRCKKYKEAVRVLRERLAAAECRADAATSGQAAAEVQASQARSELAALQERCEQHAERMQQAEAQLRLAQQEREQWERRASDAEGRAQAGSAAAEASCAAALRLAGRRAQEAEVRAGDAERQAKAASLRVLHLEKELRQELETRRGVPGPATAATAQPAPPQQAEEGAKLAPFGRLQSEAAAEKAAAGRLRARLGSADAARAAREEELRPALALTQEFATAKAPPMRHQGKGRVS